MEPLQIQASLATDYLTMSEELKDIEIAVIAHDLSDYVFKKILTSTKSEALLEIKQALTIQIEELKQHSK